MAAIWLAALCGCTTIVVGDSGEREIVSIGITRIQLPERQGDLLAFKRTGIGLGYGNAVQNTAWLGFDQSEWVIADPAECQLLIIIRSDAEADNAAQILENLEGEDVCFVTD